MMIRRVGADRQRQTVAIHGHYDFLAFYAPGRPNFLPATFRRGKRAIDIALGFIHRAIIAKGVSKIRQHPAQ